MIDSKLFIKIAGSEHRTQISYHPFGNVSAIIPKMSMK